MTKVLSKEHRHNISEGLKLHHKRRRRSKTVLGRLINHVTRKTRRELRQSGNTNQILKISAHIQQLKKEISKLRKAMLDISTNPEARPRRARLKTQMDVLRLEIEKLKKKRRSLKGLA